jgi:ADP-ribosylation factor-binding protein GGA
MSTASSNATATPPVDSIETIFFKATSPIHKNADPNLMNLFCSKVNAEPEGHHQAIRLISHKIQSPQEHEALRTLELLEVCVQSCGRRFHQEIGKFRFLNEMIKLVSPKYLANHTSEKVKKKVIELLYAWTQSLPSEVKITEAYQMLKRQSIITEDPVYINKSSTTPVPQKTKSIFDADEEKSKTLQRLLKSRKPEDLEQANALIKSFVKKDEEKIEKLTNRASELEKVQNNIRVLSEMLIHYNHSTVTEAEKETMTYLHDELEKLRPVLFRLATESEDGDEGLGEILLASDSLSRVLAQYDRLVKQDHLIKDDNVLSIIDDILPSSTQHTLIDLAGSSNHPSNQMKSTVNELDELFGSIRVTSDSKVNIPLSSNPSGNTEQLDDCLPLFPTANTNTNKTNNQMSTNESTATKKGGLFDDLQDLLVDQSTGQKISLTKSSFQSTNSNSNKIPLNEMKNSSSSRSLESELSFPTISLESIRPSSINPPITLKLTQNTGLQCILHIARDSPRPDLIISVLTITNTNTSKTINNFHFEATVSKNIRIKLQNPSASDLPVYNPILPPQAITQIILVSNPNKETVRLSYKLSYYLSGEQINETGEIDHGFPSSIDLI